MPRRFLFLLAGLACFANPDDQGIWIVSSQVVSVLHNAGECAKGSNAKIVTSAGSYCVRETPQEVLKILESVK
jgi:hypothetical protein